MYSANSGSGQSGQSNWRWCNKCQGLFFAGNNLGVCSAGGTHNDSGSGNYLLSGSGSGQSNWQWCNKCQGLFFGGNNLGACPAGGTHDPSGSGGYALPDSGSGQPNWRWCNQCQGLFFAGNNLGVCPAHSHNDTGSDNYVLSNSGSGQSNWRWCKKCQGLFFAGNNTSGVCPAGGTHDGSNSDDYVLAPPPPPPPPPSPLLPLAPTNLQPSNGASGVSTNPYLFFRDPGAGTPSAVSQFEFWLFQNNKLLNSPPATGPGLTSAPLLSPGVKWGWGPLPTGEVTLVVQGQNAAGTGPSSTSTFTVGASSAVNPTITVDALPPLSANTFSVQGSGFTSSGNVIINVSSSLSDNFLPPVSAQAEVGGSLNSVAVPCQSVCSVAGGGQLQFTATDVATNIQSNLIFMNCH